jgi:hypothetical protein
MGGASNSSAWGERPGSAGRFRSEPWTLSPLGLGHYHIDVVAPAPGATSRSRHPGTVVSAPYRSAISAASGSTRGHHTSLVNVMRDVKI